MNKRGDLVAVLLLVAVWALVVALVGLGGDFALNDDWAYAYSARHLLRTGELRILDWAAPSLATHALWGAGALRLLGDSYVALRRGTLLWALSAILCVYGLGRTAFAPRTAVLVPLALALSPWFVNLAFTYMTDVPWLALVLAALLVFVHALHPRSSEPPRAALLALSGALIGAAATTRQFAIVVTPAFALVLSLDARRRDGPHWVWPTARGSLFFGVPAAALFVPFYLWYTYVHGPTQANRETFARMADVRPWTVLVFALCAMHYAGLWLFPPALALFLERRLGEVVTRRQALWAAVLLGGYAVGRLILGRFVDPRGPAHFDHPADGLHPLMPYLGNVFYLVGLGPPTITDLYRASEAPPPHSGAWLGVLLTLASTSGGIIGAGLLVTTMRRVRRTCVEPGAAPTDLPEDRGHRREMLRVLLILSGSMYLLFQLCTATTVFDRYLLLLLPMVFWLGLDAAPPDLARSPVIVACLAASGLFSVAGTHEYLSWGGARDRAVRALYARGVPAVDIDGGFEVNGPVHFETYRRRTGALLGKNRLFWVENAPYRISFWPSRTPDCTTEERYPYWTWPGGGDPAVYVLHCSAPVTTGASSW